MPSATVQGPQATALAAAAGRGASAAPRCGPHGGNVCVCGGVSDLGSRGLSGEGSVRALNICTMRSKLQSVIS